MKHYRTINQTDKNGFNPFISQGANVTRFAQEIIYEAVVVDVVVNDSHPEFATDGYNVGAIKFRSIKSDMYRDNSQLNWALPMDSNISEYPLVSEIVVIHTALNRFYYTRKLNVSSRVTSQALPGLNEELSPAKTGPVPLHPGATASPQKQGLTKNNSLGISFKDLGLARLRHDEGDIVIEGRSGSSIRLGAAWTKASNFQATGREQAPNLLFRVGPDTRAAVTPEFGQTLENINSDASSVYLVTDQIVPLTYATEKAATHRASIKDFPKRLDGCQIVINTDRFVVNSKKDKILGFGLNGIHWTSAKDFTVDADRDFVSKIGGKLDWSIGKTAKIEAQEQIALLASQVHIGTTGAAQPVPQGAELAKFLEKLLKIFISNQQAFISPLNPKGISPTVIASLQEMMTELTNSANAPFNSTTVFVSP